MVKDGLVKYLSRIIASVFLSGFFECSWFLYEPKMPEVSCESIKNIKKEV